MSEDKRHLYPEVIAAGGLQPALRNALAAIGSPLTVCDIDPGVARFRFSVGARVVSGPRFAQVYMAFEESLFVFELCNQGVVKAHGQSPNLIDVARTFRRWIDENLTAAEIASMFESILAIPEPSANDDEELVCRWREYISRLYPQRWSLISATHLTQPEGDSWQMIARSNFSWLSVMGRTGYPSVYPWPDGRYTVICEHCCDYGIRNVEPDRQKYLVILNGHFVYVRDAETAARLVVNHSPGRCVAAQSGTGEVVPLRAVTE